MKPDTLSPSARYNYFMTFAFLLALGIRIIEVDNLGRGGIYLTRARLLLVDRDLYAARSDDQSVGSSTTTDMSAPSECSARAIN